MTTYDIYILCCWCVTY